jgi:hypothetical protein
MTTKTIEQDAAETIDAAGAAGGREEVLRLAQLGWPETRELDGDSPELRAAIQAEARRRVIRTYSVNVTDSETPAAWMRLPIVTSLTLGAQDSGRCAFRVTTTDAEALEAALDADADVLEYEAI